jgi:integrase
MPRRPEGIVIRHGRHCASHVGKSCNCSPGYQAQVYSQRDRKPIRKTFRTLADARDWRAQTHSALRLGAIRAPSRITVDEASSAFLTAARAGIARTRAGDPYKPSAIRAYEQALRTKVQPRLGQLPLSAVTRNMIQDVVDELIATGLSASTVRNAILPLRAIYRRATARSEVLVNPTLGLALPAVRSQRERIADPEEARKLLEPLAPKDRAIWGTALYAGLRRGELKALRWQDIDFEAGLIRVERGWDDKEGPIAPKSRAGQRRVPLATALRADLAALKLRTGAEPADLAFGKGAARPFSSDTLNDRARRVWKRHGLSRIGLHECRHTYAAFMIAAGVNAKALSSYMGHSSITITLDRYGHLMPGNEEEAATMLTTYLESAGNSADHRRPR